VCVKYADWEESQKDFDRVRSVWERALEVDYKNRTLWLKYAQFENKFINHARNVFERAITFLPRVDQLWYNYIHMENRLGNVAGVRQVFEKWMEWMPDRHAWMSYIKFELKYKEIQCARDIFERFVLCHPTVASWIRYANFEIKNGDACTTRNVFERALDKVVSAAEDEEAQKLFLAFADFEASCNETDRAKCIYQFALHHHVPKEGINC
jgi:crooked neck